MSGPDLEDDTTGTGEFLSECMVRVSGVYKFSTKKKSWNDLKLKPNCATGGGCISCCELFFLQNKPKWSVYFGESIARLQRFLPRAGMRMMQSAFFRSIPCLGEKQLPDTRHTRMEINGKRFSKQSDTKSGANVDFGHRGFEYCLSGVLKSTLFRDGIEPKLGKQCAG